jgi:hypothetical protein
MFGRSSPRRLTQRRRSHRRRWRGLLLAALLTPALAQGTDLPPEPELEPEGTTARLTFTIDSGGGTSSFGTTELTGTVGQPDIGVATAGSIALIGGFWGRGVPDHIFTDGFESGDSSAWSTTVP